MVLRPEQFTEQGQEVIRNSQEMVRRYRHSQWDVEHVALSLLELETGCQVKSWQRWESRSMRSNRGCARRWRLRPR